MTRLLLVLVCVLLRRSGGRERGAAANDTRQEPQVIDGLPARVTGTTVEAASESDDPGSRCAGSRNSVFYEFRAGADGRVFLRLQADGDLDAVIDVYRKQPLAARGRSSARRPTRTGSASIGMNVKDGTTYLVRVAQLTNSVVGDVHAPARPRDARGAAARRGAAGRRPPRRGGPRPEPDGRVGGELQGRAHVPREPVHAAARRARELRDAVGLPAGDEGLRSRLAGRVAALRRLPDDHTAPGQGGRYSLLVTALTGRGSLPYNIEASHAGSDDLAPGIFVRNDSRVSGELGADRIDVVDLYRFDVRRRSTLDLGLRTTKAFDLVLLDDRGKQIECACSGEGAQSIARRISRGRYFAAVRAQRGASGRYTLSRLSRVITRTRIRIDGGRSSQSRPGEAVRLSVDVKPLVGGPLMLTIERFDPLAGWLFVSRVRTRAINGEQVVPFTPSDVGRWRARARFRGTRTAAPSGTHWARLLVARPLTE